MRRPEISILASFVLSGMLCPNLLAETTVELAEQLGITPKSLVAAEANDKASQVLSRLDDATSLRATLINQREALRVLENQLSALDQDLAQVAGSADVSQLRISIVQLYNEALASVSATLNELRVLALSDLDNTERLRMDLWRDSAPYDVPDVLRVQTHSAVEWQLIEIAIRAEARALESDSEVPYEQQSLLNDVYADPTVSVLQTQFACCLAQVTQQFNSQLQ